MQPRIQRIEQKQSTPAEDSREELSKSAAVGFFRRVALQQEVRNGLAAWADQKFRGALRQAGNFTAEFSLSDRPPSRTLHGELETGELPGVKPGYVAYLVEVVILGRHPKYGHGWYSGLAQLLGEANGAERFVEGVRRSAEQSDLLAAHHGDRTISQAVQVTASGIAGA